MIVLMIIIIINFSQCQVSYEIVTEIVQIVSSAFKSSVVLAVRADKVLVATI